MWNRIYLVVLSLCTATMAFFTYYSWTWLKSIGAPLAAVEGYLYHSGLAWKFLWVSSIALLIFANAVLAKSRRSWAMWTTFIYFTIFRLVAGFWLNPAFVRFWNANFEPSRLSVDVFVAIFLSVAAAAVVYANQFAVVRLSERMYPSKVEPEVEEVVENPTKVESGTTE